MKKYALLTTLLSLALVVSAKETTEPVDTATYKSYLLEEIVINPKANTKLFEFPGSISAFSAYRLENLNVKSIKDLSSLAPNFYIPDYGSRLTSAIYIRGIGSRINSPAVGLNVDNVPYLDKSTFDFDLMNIEKIEVLRGPQGTLYGRNTMAGLINIYTKSPFDHQGTQIKAGYGNYNNLDFGITHSHKINDQVAFSISGQYKAHDGYFKNEYKNRQANGSEMASARARIDWKINQRLKINFTSDFEYSDQDGYPYFLYDKVTRKSQAIAYNDDAGYRRKVSTNSLFLEYKHDRFILSSTTGYQYLNDQMNLDQDFTPLSIFTLTQKQKQHALTQEIAFRSSTEKNFQWVAGVYGFYQDLKTDGPVTFKEDGVRLLITSMIPPTAPIQINNRTLYIDGRYKMPTYGAAVFKQMTYNNLFVNGLSGTIGLRLNYEKTKLDHNTNTVVNVKTPMITKDFPIVVKGNEKMDALELLPKFELKYLFDKNYFVYGSVSRGYRSGGYNNQMFSDIIQAKMKNLMNPEAVKDEYIKDVISYEPEHSWNYEIGGRLDLLDNQLSFDLSAFYIDCRNQQISEFADNGYGRQTKNTGRTASKGMEFCVKAFPVKRLQLTAAYGYTHATFTEYSASAKDGTRVDYKGNFVPFAPLHSLAVTADYTFLINKNWLDEIRIGAQYIGKGKIYWTEENDVAQNFYGLTNAEVTLSKGCFDISLWGKNILDTRYHAFYFETLNAENTAKSNGFAEQGRPATFGITVKARF